METYGEYQIRLEEADGAVIAWAKRVDGRMINVGHAKQYEIGSQSQQHAEDALAEIKAIIDGGSLTT